MDKIYILGAIKDIYHVIDTDMSGLQYYTCRIKSIHNNLQPILFYLISADAIFIPGKKYTKTMLRKRFEYTNQIIDVKIIDKLILLTDKKIINHSTDKDSFQRIMFEK